MVRNAAAITFRRVLLRGDERAAVRALGRDHPLARTLGLRHSLLVQLLTTLIPLAFALVGLALHAQRAAAVLAAAALVAAALCVALLVVGQSTRERARQVIAAADDVPELEPVLLERRRLTSRRTRERLARSLEGFLRDAEEWDELHPRYRPPLEVRCLRFAADDVRNVAARLRFDAADVRGVAAVAGFLSESSPLFSGDVAKLRAALERLSDLLGPARDEDLERAAA